MRFSESWLREWVNPSVDTQTLADQLSMAGLEVDAITPAAAVFSGVAVGLVIEVASHPNAEKLHVCTVDLGEGEPLTIVCGAANVAAGMRVPVATIGAVMPGDFKIKRARLRGVESFGMICSASELGLAETSSGILPLPEDAPLGADFRAWLGLDDACIEVDLTPDRGDCLSIAGLAWEVAAINGCALTPLDVDPVAAASEERFPVSLEAPEHCPRYACRIIRGIDPAAVTPLWMRERLRRGGIRAISPVVDVTNYVLLELGQPMHGFDLGCIKREIRVRLAAAGERLHLLNGETIVLRPDTLVIADAAGPLALAGIMGGAASAVESETRDILLESAFFAPAGISGKARSYGLHTDSSHRFERGVDPGLQVRALERATGLLLAIVGGEAGPVVDVTAAGHLPQRAPLTLRSARCAQILGFTLPDETIAGILERLGMTLVPVAGGWQVTAPSGRFDLVHEVDLIADVGRIYGYDRIPVSHATSAAGTRARPEGAFDLDRVRLLLVDRGFQEVITYSFVNPELQARIEPEVKGLALANPISAELSVMRPSLWPGLLHTARYNQARQQERVRIFETGLRFRPGPDGLRQEAAIGGLTLGAVDPEQWGAPARLADFYSLKADVEALLALSGDPAGFHFVAAEHPALHPGQSARIDYAGQPVGLLGMLHPALAADLDLTGDAFLFELDQAALSTGVLPRFTPVSRYPAIRRDLAIVVDEAVAYLELAAAIREAAGELLRDLVLFDVYVGSKIAAGQKSLALGLILQVSSQTLTDQVVDDVVGRVLTRLVSDFGARLRD
ncbi:phenylalanine--tRNA ligase subunit beta [uncultured Thiodictyon sp.]|uniref:phenylalanine--tRNA ligase subunit beta n=1 Tax=uncultured Thiodictyon sp. TaxID=1846217 RepID=UPI0025E37985|nr:phenylalanine--tRNA ligase subunit beta [uncultured Thiodictyon sp.]